MQTGNGIWRQTPPAIFPPILGLLGLGLAWRQMPDFVAVGSVASELILGAAVLLFGIAAVAYLAKFLRRPTALVDDLRVLPGRAGISTATMAAMLASAALVPISTCLASLLFFAGMAAHLIVVATVLSVLWRAPTAQSKMTAVWHLPFVGLIVAVQSGVGLGYSQISDVVFFITAANALAIYYGSGRILMATAMPPPLRPTLAIHLAPVSLLGIAAHLLGYIGTALVFSWLALALAVVLLIRFRYLTAAGFSPFWGAFTFPVAGFSGLMLMTGQHGGGFWTFLGILAVAFATLLIPTIAYRIIKMWARGDLATKTNASKV